MSQSLRVVKRFRIRELITPSSPKNSRISPATTAASNLHTSEESSPPSRSGTGGTLTLNPFVPHKNPESGRWAPPKYSLRRQAVLIKHARASGTLHLLPPGPKMSSNSSAQLLAATTTSSSSLLGKGHVVVVEEEENAEAVVVRSGLVSLRRGEEVQVQEREQQQQRLRPGQEGEAAVEKMEKVGEAQAQGEVLALAPEQKNSLNAQADWTIPVEWIGKVRERNVAGADVGNRLYAGKKRMFKGHKWERTRERRVGRTNMLLRDMDKRIQRFKEVRYILSVFGTILPPPLSSFADGFFLFLFCGGFFLVPCQGQAIAASKEEERVEEDTEAAVLSA
ncbi:hypothetical protein F5888DRAFT_1704552 [Russula emetica]|nr:hypothetical protein F5888DRAFT_1704552 [Russula emetica]